MTYTFSKIWVTVVLVIFIAGGFFAWQYFGVPREKLVTEVNLSSDARSIQAVKNREQIQIYSIEQWQEFAAKNQDIPILKPWPHPTAPGVEITYKNYTYFTNIALSPNKNRIAFVVGGVGGGAWGSHSIIGILNLQTDSVDLLTRESELRQIIWSPDAQDILYFTVSDYTGGGSLVVYDSIRREEIFEINDIDVAQLLGLKIGGGTNFFSEFRDVKWSPDSKKIYFSTNSKTDSLSPELGVADWVVNVDGSGLERLTKTTD